MGALRRTIAWALSRLVGQRGRARERSALTALAVMSLALGLLASAAGPALGADPAVFSVDPRRTYLRTNSDAPLDALKIDLAALGIAPGNVIRLERLGAWDCGAPCADTVTGMGGVFSAGTTLLGPSAVHRVPGAVDAGVELVTGGTFFGALPTDIPEDFAITDTTIQVPLGATHLFVGALDSLYSDNSDPNGDFKLQISVVDVSPPTITAPPAVNVTTGAGATSCSTFVSDATLGSATATDDAPGTVSVTRTGVPDGNSFPKGITTITYTATDAAGNTASATQTVTVVDDTPPVITAPADVSVSTDPGLATALVSDAVLGAASAADNCPGLTLSRGGVPSGNLFPAGTTTITYTATDASGNTASATQSVTVADTERPSITAPPPISMTTDSGSCGAFVPDAILGAASATDNSPGLIVSRSGVPVGNVFPKGTTTITYTATDAAGNTSSASQSVTIVDAEPPSITVPANVSVSTDPGLATAFVSDAALGNPSAADNCPGLTVSRTGIPSGNLFPAGTTTITYTATDAAGNTASATQTVTVILPLPATFDLHPMTINQKAKGTYITGYIESADGSFDPTDVDISTVTLQVIDPVTSAKLNVATGSPTAVGDGNGNGLVDLLVKFDRATVQSWFSSDTTAVFRVEGRLLDGRQFAGEDASVRIINAGIDHADEANPDSVKY